MNCLTQINYLQSSGGVAPPTPVKAASYAYDDLSRLTSAINDAGTVSFTYDNRNRIKTTTDVFGHLIEYGYDDNGNRTQLKLDGAVHASYAYDVANRLTTLTDEANQNFMFSYDIADKFISKTLPNSVTTTFSYDGMSRLTELKHQSSTATLTDNDFSYNPANQISQIAELAQTKNFTYDNIDRLTNMTNGTANESYAFDAVGNRTSSHRSSTYGYQANNKLTSTQTAAYAYDANGNLLSKSDASGFWVYGWDYENRMISARKQNKIVRYQYDALGRRVLRMGKGVGMTKFTYDGQDVVMDEDFNNGLVKYQNGLGIDNKLKISINGAAKYFLQDHLGSTVGLTDASGAILSSASYDSFGNSTNSLTTRYQYTGREKDEFTDLYFYRARWYDANLGRFVSEDPIKFRGGINWFAYVKNSPVKFRDALGLYPYESPDDFRDIRRNGFPAPHSGSNKSLACEYDGYNPWFTGEFGGDLQFGPVGGADSIVVAFNPLTQELCFYTKLMSGMGGATGFLASAGGQLGLSFGPAEGRKAEGGTAELFLNAAAFEGGSGNISLGGLGGGIGIGDVIGGGAAGGLRIGEMTLLFCINKNKCSCKK